MEGNVKKQEEYKKRIFFLKKGRNGREKNKQGEIERIGKKQEK